MTDTTTVLLSPMVGEDHRARLRGRFPSVRFVPIGTDGAVPPEGVGARALLRVGLTKPALSTALRAAPSVRWVHTSTAGFDWAMVPEVLEPGRTLTRSAASYAIPIGEFTVTLIAALAKRLPQLAAAQRERRWAVLEPLELADLTVGIVGAGGIGREVAWRCRALGMRTIATQRTPVAQPHYDDVLPASGLFDLLQRSDAVVIACPLTPETRGLIDAAALAAMRRTAFLINVARGPIVVESDLVAALRDGTIAGAAMDAFAEEPLPEASPLWDAPNFVATPHTSFKSPHNLDRVLGEFEENLERFLADQPLANALRDPTLGY